MRRDDWGMLIQFLCVRKGGLNGAEKASRDWMREWPASVLYTPCYKDKTMHSAKSQYSTQYCLAILEARQPQLDYFCINSFYVSFTSISKIAQYANISLFMTRVKD